MGILFYWASPQAQIFDAQLPSFTHIVLPRIVTVPFGIFSFAWGMMLWFSVVFTALGVMGGAPAYALAWLLEKPNAEQWLKVFWLSFIIVGFHFDLLGS
jgi:hypothetical protein